MPDAQRVGDVFLPEEHFLAVATQRASMGHRVFPARPGTKRPAMKGWPIKATSDRDVVMAWWSSTWAGYNVCIATGLESGFWVLDVDTKDGHDGPATLRALQDTHGKLPDTYTVVTPSGGYQLYFAYPTDGREIKNSASSEELGDGLDVRGWHGQCLAPGSVTADGPYVEHRNLSIAVPPEWLITLCEKKPFEHVRPDGATQYVQLGSGRMQRYCASAMNGERAKLAEAAAGTRNDQLNKSAFALGTIGSHGALDREEVYADLRQSCLDNGWIPEWGNEGFEATFDSGWNAGLQHPRTPWPPASTLVNEHSMSFTFDDIGNAHRFVNKFGQNVRWDGDSWIVWDETRNRWFPDADGMIMRLAEQITVDMWSEAEKLLQDPDAEQQAIGAALKAHAKKCRSNGALRNMLEQVKVRPGVTMSEYEFDRQPNLLACTNGVLELHPGGNVMFRPQTREDMLALNTETPFKPDAKDPLWTSILERFVPSPQLRHDLQRLLGYSLMDGNPDRKLVFLKGETSSGKTTVMEVVGAALGSYADPFSLSLLRDNQDERPRADIFHSLPKRLIYATEASAEWHLHADQVKRITGDDQMRARLPHGSRIIKRLPAFVPWIATNNMPRMDGADPAVWRRLVVLPFDASLSVAEEVADFKRRAMTESRAAVLAWLVVGWQLYGRDGLRDLAQETAIATADARVEMNPIDQFLMEACIADPDAVQVAGDFLTAYRMWLTEAGYERLNVDRAKFAGMLSARGYKRKQNTWICDSAGMRVQKTVWTGVRLNNQHHVRLWTT